MGKIVGGFLVPHDPVMFVAPEAPPTTCVRAWAAFDTCAQRLAELNPTSVVIVGADHYLNFGTGCLPQYLIGTGDVDGPLDVLPGLKRQVIPDSQAWPVLSPGMATNTVLTGRLRVPLRWITRWRSPIV